MITKFKVKKTSQGYTLITKPKGEMCIENSDKTKLDNLCEFLNRLLSENKYLERINKNLFEYAKTLEKLAYGND